MEEEYILRIDFDLINIDTNILEYFIVLYIIFNLLLLF